MYCNRWENKKNTTIDTSLKFTIASTYTYIIYAHSTAAIVLIYTITLFQCEMCRLLWIAFYFVSCSIWHNFYYASTMLMYAINVTSSLCLDYTCRHTHTKANISIHTSASLLQPTWLSICETASSHMSSNDWYLRVTYIHAYI